MIARSSWLWVSYWVSARINFWEKKATGYHWTISDWGEFGFLWVIWPEKCWFEVIWLRTPLIAYPKVSVSIWIWHSRLKYLRIEALVKTFRRCMKAFLALGVRKSVLKLAFAKSDFLDLVSFGFLDLAGFITVDRFLRLLLTPPLLAPPAASGAS